MALESVQRGLEALTAFQTAMRTLADELAAERDKARPATIPSPKPTTPEVKP